MLVRCLHCKNVLEMRDVPAHAAVVCTKAIALGAVHATGVSADRPGVAFATPR